MQSFLLSFIKETGKNIKLSQLESAIKLSSMAMLVYIIFNGVKAIKEESNSEEEE